MLFAAHSQAAESSPGNTPVQDKSPLNWLAKLEVFLVLAYAFSLPLSMTLSWGLLIAGMVMATILWLFNRREGEQLPVEAAPLLMPLVTLGGVVMLSGFANGGIGEGFASLWALKPLLVYFWGFSIFSRYRHLVSSVVQVLLVVGALAGLWGTVQQLTGFHPFSYKYLQGTGFLGGPMAFAGQMQILSLLGLCLAVGSGFKNFVRPLNQPIIFAGIAIANCLGVFFASERSAWLGFIAAVLVVTALWSGKTLLRSLLLLVVIAGVSWFTVPVVQQRLAPLSNWQNDVSVRVRFFLWQEAINHWQKSPLLGVGIRRFPHFNIPEAVVPGRSIDINHAHSNYLQILTTTGVVGFVAYLWLCLAAVVTAFKSFRQHGTLPEQTFERALSLGILGGTIALLVSGIFEYNFGTAQVRLLQWFVLAMLVRVK